MADTWYKSPIINTKTGDKKPDGYQSSQVIETVSNPQMTSLLIRFLVHGLNIDFHKLGLPVVDNENYLQSNFWSKKID